MAKLYVQFCRLMVEDGTLCINMRNGVISEDLSISASNAQTTAVATRDKPWARVHCDAACQFTVGSNPNASTETTNRISLASGAGTYVLCDVGDKIAAITI